MLGGGSAVNGMMYVRGSDRDYDHWAELLDDPSWNYRSVLPYFKKAERNLDIAIAWDKGRRMGKSEVLLKGCTPSDHPRSQASLSAFLT